MVEHFFDFFTSLSGISAYLAIFSVLFVCGLGIPIPEDITLIAAGYIAYDGEISLWGAMIVGFVGVLIGDAMLFMAGRKFGRRVFGFPGFRRVFTEERIASAEKKIRANEYLICFMARFLPGLRSAIFLTSGMVGVRPIVFFSQDGMAAIISVPLWVYVGYAFGETLDETLKVAKHIQIYLFSTLALLIFCYVIYKTFFKGKNSPSSVPPR